MEIANHKKVLTISVPAEKGKTMREKLIELCERSLANDGTGREMRFAGGDVVPAVRKAIQEWIPVSERLPKHFGCVIVAIRNPNSERLGVDCADFDPFKKYWYPSMCWDKGYEVTHWMPLPPCPEDAK